MREKQALEAKVAAQPAEEDFAEEGDTAVIKLLQFDAEGDEEEVREAMLEAAVEEDTQGPTAAAADIGDVESSGDHGSGAALGEEEAGEKV